MNKIQLGLVIVYFPLSFTGLLDYSTADHLTRHELLVLLELVHGLLGDGGAGAGAARGLGVGGDLAAEL